MTEIDWYSAVAVREDVRDHSPVLWNITARMSQDVGHLIEQSEAPDNQKVEELDVRNLGPPKPLSKTLELLTEIDEKILVQFNDRAPQHLYPKLEDRGYRYDTFERDDVTITLIWERE